MAKRYYWLKLPDDFFRQKPIKKLRKIAGGDTYTIIYLKMLLIAMKQDGRLYFDGVEDDFYDDLALDLDEEAENVKVTVMFLVRQGLMELIDDSEYLLTEVENMTGSESSSASRVRRHREKLALHSNTDVTVCNELKQNCNVEKEIEIEKEIDKEKDKTLCPEVITSRQEQIFISLPLVTGSGSYDVTFDYVNSLRELYPAIDVEQEFRKMYGWLDSNPTNRKTQRGIKRFITGWLARAQDRAPSSKTANNRNMSTSQYMESTAGWYSE
jgi:predicted phage replisome organizer